MKVTKYLPILAVCLMTTGCNSKKEAVLTSGIDLANLDTTAMPGTSFYQYACGGWVAAHPLTDEYSRFGTFDMLRENSREQLKTLIAELAAKKDNAPGSAAQKVGDLYNIAMDSVKLNQEGVAPIKAELEAIDALQDKGEIYTYIAEIQKKGINPYFSLYIGADDMNSSMNLVQTYQEVLEWDNAIIIWRMTSKQRISVINIRNILPRCFSWLVMMKLLHKKL